MQKPDRPEKEPQWRSLEGTATHHTSNCTGLVLSLANAAAQRSMGKKVGGGGKGTAKA